MCGECLAEVMGRYASRTQFCELRRPSVAGEEGRGFSDEHQLCSERRGESSSGGSDKHLSCTPPGEEGGSSAGGSDKHLVLCSERRGGALQGGVTNT